MDPELLDFLAELGPLLAKHHASMFYTTADDGIHVCIGPWQRNSVSIGWPHEGSSLELKNILSTYQL